MKTNHNIYLNQAFEIAKINLGKTKSNPSVGCVVVKNNSVISSACTALNGRPHAEFKALSTSNKFFGSDMYVTMEPCTHKGKTPPCTNIILKKGIKRIFYSFNDLDERTSKKLKKTLSKTRVKIFKRNTKIYSNFYQSYFYNIKKKLPYIDGKIAISKDFYTINKYSKWITSKQSRSRAHLIRSEYDSILSTSKTINMDNSLLNCRLNGFNKNKPDLLIVDIKLRIKKNLKLYGLKKRKIFIVTSVEKSSKINYLKKKGVKFIKIKSLENKKDFLNLFKILKTLGFNRILVESGLTFLNTLIKERLIFNLYVFQSLDNLRKKGRNNTSNKLIKNFKLNKKINVNLNNDCLYKVRVK